MPIAICGIHAQIIIIDAVLVVEFGNGAFDIQPQPLCRADAAVQGGQVDFVEVYPYPGEGQRRAHKLAVQLIADQDVDVTIEGVFVFVERHVGAL